jgi:hypothetical protein
VQQGRAGYKRRLACTLWESEKNAHPNPTYYNLRAMGCAWTPRRTQSDTAARNLELTRQLDSARDALSSLEARVGSSASPMAGSGADPLTAIAGVATTAAGKAALLTAANVASILSPRAALGQGRGGGAAATPATLPLPGSSLSERLARLERRADALAVTTGRQQASSSLHACLPASRGLASRHSDAISCAAPLHAVQLPALILALVP